MVLLTATVRKICRIVFWLEIVINVINGIIAMVDPVLALQGMTNVDLHPSDTNNSLVSSIAAGMETYRWFGALSLVFGGYIFYRVLDTPGLKPVLEGLLIGDILYLGSLTPFTLNYGKMPMIIGPYALTVIMFIARIIYLFGENWNQVHQQYCLQYNNSQSTVETKTNNNDPSDISSTTLQSSLLSSNTESKDKSSKRRNSLSRK